jgi:hypothetical protein
VTTPYLSEYFPPLALPPEYGDGTYLEPDTTYSATITVFSDEHSYIKLKKFYFKFGKNGPKAGFTPECVDVNVKL